YECEVMHLRAHIRGGLTEPDNLALGCPSDHKLHDEGWSVRVNPEGIVEWLPPPHFTREPGINNFFHPERYCPTTKTTRSARAERKG
ncbi:MAG: HNH endonuclease signature motif containing protein, partial [Candidatus Sericytochromatia bacterium]